MMHCGSGVLKGNYKGALAYLLSGVQKCGDLRGFLRDNDQFRILVKLKRYVSKATLVLLSYLSSPYLCLYTMGK